MNLDTWNKLAKPPVSALKRIMGGRLSGKSDINPQWRYRTMTEHFGVCGFGWKYTLDRLWTEPGDAGEVFAFAQVSLFVKQGEQWSEPIPGIGGNMLREAERGGIHNNDEAFKMATTDALGAAMKMLGVAAEVYLGNFDGSKYRTEEKQPVQSNSTNAQKVAAVEIMEEAAGRGAAALAEAWKALSTEMKRTFPVDHKDRLKQIAEDFDNERQAIQQEA